MQSKPIYFNLLGIYLCVFAIIYPFNKKWLPAMKLKEMGSLLMSQPKQIYLVAILALLGGVMAWRVSRRLPIVIFGLFLVTLLDGKYFSAFFYSDRSLWMNAINAALFVVPLALLLMPQNILLLKEPHLRWWRNAKRFERKFNLRILNQDRQALDAKIINISTSGALIEVNKELIEDAMLALTIKTKNNIRPLNCWSKVVRWQADAATGQSQMGVKFIGLTNTEKQNLNKELNF